MSGIYSQDFAICPHCNERTNSRVDHLYPGPTTAGPWNCNACGQWYDIKVRAPGDVALTPSKWERERIHDGYALLRFDGKEGPVFFIMKCARYGTKTPEDQQSSDRYLYEEHSCPTNWLRDCVEVVEGGEIDPHGFLTFIRSVDAPKDDDGEGNDSDWRMIFPEAFGAIEIDGTAENVTAPRLLK